MLNLVLMRKENPYCWALMPAFIESVMNFSAEHTAGGTDSCADNFQIAFGAGLKEMMGIAIVDSDEPGQLAGHVICGQEQYLGKRVCMVYQFNKESGTSEDWRELNKGIQALIDNWCHGCELQEIMAMAESESRGRLFRLFGYEKGPVLMRRRFR
jgi:hypothetical protein